MSESTAFAEQVRRETSRILGRVMLQFGPDHEVSQVLCDLNSRAANLVGQTALVEEQAAGYDLGALGVDPNKPSNSETGWEREE